MLSSGQNSCQTVIRLLTDKDYQVIYERMLVMPPNLLLDAEANLYWDFDTRLPVYRNNCQLCLRCYYNCPAHAIHAPKLERWLLERYDIDQMKRLASETPEKSIDECCKSLLWIGVKRYLKEIWD